MPSHLELTILCYAIKIFVARLSCMFSVRQGGMKERWKERERKGWRKGEREEERKRKKEEREVGEGGREEKKTRKKETSRVFHSFLGNE